jgi:hypothetical protein
MISGVLVPKYSLSSCATCSVAASMFLHSQSFITAVMVVLCLLSCLLGLYRVQVSFFTTETSSSIALRQDVKHVVKFVGVAIPFFILLFLFFSFELKAFIYPVLPQHASAYPISEL